MLKAQPNEPGTEPVEPTPTDPSPAPAEPEE